MSERWVLRETGAAPLGTLHYCGQRHKTWSGLARCLFRDLRPIWILGTGEWATLSYCPPGLTIMLHETRAEAEKALAQIDDTGCGGRCEERHYLRLISPQQEGSDE